MLTRREVLESGAALIASPVALSVSAAHRRPGRQGAQPRAFLVDARSADALAIAELMAARGVRVREYRSDLSEIYHECFAGAGSEEGVIAGVMGVAPLFYVERLAWTRRIVFLGRHVTPQQHTVGGPEVMVDAFRAGARLTDWRRALAHVLLSTPAGAAPLRPLSAVRDAAISGDSALYSWVLARA